MNVLDACCADRRFVCAFHLWSMLKYHDAYLHPCRHFCCCGKPDALPYPDMAHLSHCSFACARRDAEVLSLFAAIISKLREAMGAEVPRIFEAVFECTLQMITKNFEVCCALMHDAQGTHARTIAVQV